MDYQHNVGHHLISSPKNWGGGVIPTTGYDYYWSLYVNGKKIIALI